MSMALDHSNPDTTTEHCDGCGEPTVHRVAIEIRTESRGDRAEFSREPYRVAECRACGERDVLRMNNA